MSCENNENAGGMQVGLQTTSADEHGMENGTQSECGPADDSISDIENQSKLVEAAPASEDRPSPVEAAPASEGHPSPVEAAPASEDQPSPVEAAPANEGQPSPVEAAPVNEGQPSPVEAAPANEGQPSPVEAAPANEGQPSPVEAAPANEGQPSPVETASANEGQPTPVEAAPANEGQPSPVEAAPANEDHPSPGERKEISQTSEVSEVSKKETEMQQQPAEAAEISPAATELRSAELQEKPKTMEIAAEAAGQSQEVTDTTVQSASGEKEVSTDQPPSGSEKIEETSAAAEEKEDIEDGELSEDDGGEATPVTSTTDATAGAVSSSLTTDSSNTDQVKDNGALAAPTKRTRKTTETSDDAQEKGDSSSSSSEEESRSERKRRKKEKERRKKEKKLKRKREKQEKLERKKRKRQRKMEDEYQDDNYRDYDGYGHSGWRKRDSRSPQRKKRGYGGSYSGYREDGRSQGGEDMYGSPPDPYASPPDESSEDEFSETLYSLVGDELMDPNVSAAEKEVIFKKQQERIPGLSAGKLKKVMKKKRFQEQQRQRHRDNQRRDRRDGSQRDKIQKCRYYAEGKCQKGERCQFSHNFIPAKKMEACKFFLQGYCAKSDMCIYLHSEVPCRYYHTGQKCFNGDKCKFSHDPLTDSTKPLLEKAIMLEETGTFKSERPSLLGSPPRDANREDGGFGSDNEMEPPTDLNKSSSHIPSILDLNLKPTVEMQQKLDAGLYDELTAPLTDSEEDKFGSPPPKSFYSDTLATTNRSNSSSKQLLNSPGKTRKNRWGPDLPTAQLEDAFGNEKNGADFHQGGGDADRPKKTPLLPIPSQPAPFSQATTPAVQPVSSGDIDASTAQAAAKNLSKILNALRSGAVQANNSSQGSDPRAPAAVADPRIRAQDPRVASTMPDPRSQPTVEQPTVPRSAIVEQNHHVDPRAAAHVPQLPSLTHRPVPELNGKFTRVMDFNLVPVYVEVRTSYIPAGADSSQEMLRDPRIKKRVLAMRQEGQSSLPSLPDITADLQRLQNARHMPAPPASTSRQTSRTSVDSVSDPRRNSLESKQPSRGQGDQNSNTESVVDGSSKARNTARTSLSKVNPMSLGVSYNNSYEDDDEDENNSLTIDMPEDDSKSTAKPMETACT